MGSTPTTDEDWIIHSINIHGVFFERLCQTIINGSGSWRVTKTNYPVEFPPPHRSIRGQESALDIAAEHRSHRAEVVLLVECKKHNPEFVNWIFFPKQRPSSTDIYFVQQITNSPSSQTQWDTFLSFEKKTEGVIIADEARETRASYENYKRQDKTKTSNTAIADAARQVALATQSIVFEEAQYSRMLSGREPGMQLPYHRKVFVPAIVTNARLLSCTFDPRDVSPRTGEIDFAKARLEEKPYLVYEYPIPRVLQYPPPNIAEEIVKNRLELYARMHILVIHSNALAATLPELPALLNLY